MYGYQARRQANHSTQPQEDTRWSYNSPVYPDLVHKLPEFTTVPSTRAYDSKPLLAPSSLKRSSDTSTDHDTFSDRQAKASHNQVERKYRENLNSKFELLRKAVPSTKTTSNGQALCDGADVEELAKIQKPRKAEILASATAYMKEMEDSNRLLREEVESLKARNQELEKNTRCENCWLRNDFGNMTFEHPTDYWAGHKDVLSESLGRRRFGDDEEPFTASD